MPYLKSSSKTGTELKLYRSELRDLSDVTKLAQWIAQHDAELAEAANAVAAACQALLLKVEAR